MYDSEWDFLSAKKVHCGNVCELWSPVSQISSLSNTEKSLKRANTVDNQKGIELEIPIATGDVNTGIKNSFILIFTSVQQ